MGSRIERGRGDGVDGQGINNDTAQPGVDRPQPRLPTEPLMQNVLGVPIPKVVVQVVVGRNIAVLVEAAVRNMILQLRGINVYEEFAARQRAAMAKGFSED